MGAKGKGLRGKDIITALTQDTVERKTSQKVLTIIISALEDDPLRSIQECEIAKEAGNKLQQRYAGKTMIKTLGLLNNLQWLKQ